MPIPIILGVAVGAAALYGAYKGASGVIDNNDAKDINENAKDIVDKANGNIEKQRENTDAILSGYGQRKLRSFNGPVADFITVFGQLKNVDVIHTPELDKLNVGEFSSTSLTGMKNDYELLKSSGLGLGAGMSGGAALAFGAYNGTMLLATASTGTAISTLSGAAATNATLAWLGGGSIAAGGGGMALGTMVLGGIVAGPALAIFGHIVGNKGEEALNNARSNLEQAKTIRAESALMLGKLTAIGDVCTLADQTFSKISGQLRRANSHLKDVINIEGEDYQQLSSNGRAVVFEAVKFAQLIKVMIDTPILDQDGNLVLSTQKKLKEIQNECLSS